MNTTNRRNRKAMSVTRLTNQAADIARLEKSRSALQEEVDELKKENLSLRGKVAALMQAAATPVEA